MEIIINISTILLSRNNGVEFFRLINLEKCTAEYNIQGLHEVMARNTMAQKLTVKAPYKLMVGSPRILRGPCKQSMVSLQ